MPWTRAWLRASLRLRCLAAASPESGLELGLEPGALLPPRCASLAPSSSIVESTIVDMIVVVVVVVVAGRPARGTKKRKKNKITVNKTSRRSYYLRKLSRGSNQLLFSERRVLCLIGLLLLPILSVAASFPTLCIACYCTRAEPGTGKSSFAVRNFPRCERITLHRELLPEDLIGTMELRGGDTVRVMGPVVRAMVEGIPLVLDEIDQHSPEVRCLLHAILDDIELAGITLPDGNRIVPAKGFCVFATTNASPDSLAPALRSRFDLVVAADSAPAELIAKLGKAGKLLAAHYERIGAPAAWRRSNSHRVRLSRLTNCRQCSTPMRQPVTSSAHRLTNFLLHWQHNKGKRNYHEHKHSKY